MDYILIKFKNGDSKVAILDLIGMYQDLGQRSELNTWILAYKAKLEHDNPEALSLQGLTSKDRSGLRINVYASIIFNANEVSYMEQFANEEDAVEYLRQIAIRATAPHQKSKIKDITQRIADRKAALPPDLRENKGEEE